MAILYLYTIPDQSRGCSTGMLGYKPQGMAINDTFISVSPSVRASRANDSRFKSTPRTFGAGCILHACRPALILPPRIPIHSRWGHGRLTVRTSFRFFLLELLVVGLESATALILVSFHCIHPVFPLCPLNFYC